MNRSILPVVILSCLFVTFFACSNKPRRSRKPVSSISVIPSAQNYLYGQTVAFRVNTRVKNGEIDKISLYYNGELLEETDRPEFTVEGIRINSTGNNTVRVTAIKTDSVSNSRIVNFNAVSDVTPKKYTYSVVNVFPHNDDFYTQGLLFHKGYLYEGTGET